MPPRIVTFAVVALWLATAGWWVTREYVNKSDLPPPFKFTPDEEFRGQPEVVWRVIYQNRRVGTLRTGVSRLMPDEDAGEAEPPRRRFRVFSHQFKAEGRRADLCPFLDLASTLFVRPQGDVVGMRTVIQGKGGPKLRWEAGEGEATADLFNPLQPVDSVKGLYEGRAWKVQAVDLLAQARDGLAAPPRATWTAHVTEDDLVRRNNEEILCWRVDYLDADGNLACRTWVRQEDAWVLRQEVRCAEGWLMLRRIPGKLK